MASGLPFNGHTRLLRVVFNSQINPLTGKIDSTAFTPRPRDEGLLSTEHGDRPGGARAYRQAVELEDVAGIWAVTVAECEAEPHPVPPIDDGGEEGNSPWHVSIDFREYLNESKRVKGPGQRKAKYLRDHAEDRGKLA